MNGGNWSLTMTLQLQEPTHVDEPREVKEYADVITRVAAEGQAIVVRRAGADVAVVVPLAYFELIREAMAREEAERLTKTIDWKGLAKTSPPPQSWFDGDEPKPF
jgi:antitoxin (DNA-binding transcriptional repressor) of toxin-antitoxin stability system